MIIKAKFRCNNTPYEGAREVHMHPVYGDGTENKSYAQATPCGNLSLTITNPDAFPFFVPGEEYYLDITSAKPAEPAPVPAPEPER